ncbi:MAG TPA: CocE/NonD family hydrolase [Terriglobia bacterium]|nr:CocE/NonD family hydrolase [Terriglobia bacterium]
MFSKTRLVLCIALLWISVIVVAQNPFENASDYSKSEHQIAMRDGIKLFTVVYAPKDTTQTYPILMMRTPYGAGPYGPANYRPLGPNLAFEREGYIFVYQDVRGRYMSEGDFKWMTPYIQNKRGPTDVDESTDTYDTIEWLLKNIPNNNGRVGIYGISYPGFYTAAALMDPHPALKAASPQAPLADNYLGDDVHHNGAYWLPHTFNFISFFDQPRSGPTERYPQGIFLDERDGYKFFLELGPLANANNKYFHSQFKDWNDWMAHGDYDSYWQAQNVPQHLKKITTAVMTVGGWFDAEDLQGPLRIYKTLEKQNPDTFNVLVMGPWSHGGWAGGSGNRIGKVTFGSSTAAFYRENMELPFFNYYLKDKGQLDQPEAYVFETGSNQWKTYDQWPPRNERTESLYLDPNGKLGFTRPANTKSDAFDEYVSDPANPVPYFEGAAMEMVPQYMVEDQRFVATRPDVLVYQTDPLAEDVTVAGPVGVNLVVSTSGTDSDFVVKLIDVQPDGYQMLVRGEPFRAKYRNSFSKPEPMKSNSPTKIDYEMPDINHAFLKGHRIMVQVQSSWFPLMDRNPQKFVNIYKATDADFQKARERVYHSASLSSQLKIRRIIQ